MEQSPRASANWPYPPHGVGDRGTPSLHARLAARQDLLARLSGAQRRTKPLTTPLTNNGDPESHLAYGYVLALENTPTERTECDEAVVVAYARREGYRFAETYFEWDAVRRPALRMLVSELRRTGAEYVIVPAPAHLGAKEAQQNVARRRLGRVGRATVVVLGQDEDGIEGRADG